MTTTAILLRAHFQGGYVGQKAAFLDVDIETLVQDFVGCVVLVAAGHSVGVFRCAMECQQICRRVFRGAPIDERYLFRSNLVNAMWDRG